MPFSIPSHVACQFFALAYGQKDQGVGNVLPVQAKMFLLHVLRGTWDAFKFLSHWNGSRLTVPEADLGAGQGSTHWEGLLTNTP